MTSARRWHMAAAVFGSFVSVACGSSAVRGVQPVVVDTTWYVSARAREDGRDTRRLSDSLEFGFVVTRRLERGDPLRRNFDAPVVDSARLTASEFVARLGERVRTSRDTGAAAFLYVHGFGTSLHEAWEHTVQSGIRSRSAGPWVVFCWPSNGMGFDWPRRGELFVRAYRDDSISAGASRAAFARTANHVLDAVGGDDLLLLTHSMGAQVAGEALATDTALRARLTADPLRAIMFFAPDVAVERFRDHLVPAVKPLADRLLLYASSNDRLLAISRGVNGVERAGLVHGEHGRLLAMEGLESIDVTRGVAAENLWQRNLGSHHALRRSSAALFDIAYVVGGRFPPVCRETLGTATKREDGTWRLTSMAPPSPASVSRCAR